MSPATQHPHPPGSVRVWDPLVRLLHGSLVASVTLAWLATLHLGLSAWHERAGLFALGTAALRLAWGLYPHASPPRLHARFSRFVRRPIVVWRYTRQILTHSEPRYLGHNPLGGWMVLALLAWVAAIGCTGWLQTTDRYWGSEPLAQVHTLLAWSLLGLIALHVAGVAFTSLRHREALIKAMWTGRKIPPSGDDVA